MYVGECTCAYVHHVCVHVYEYVGGCKHLFVCMCVHVFVYVCVYIRASLHVCVYVCVHVCVHICVCVCVFWGGVVCSRQLAICPHTCK